MRTSSIGFLGGSALSPVPLSIVRPQFPPLESFAERFSAALASGQVTNNGPSLVAFEDALTDYVGAPSIAFNNGQSALMVMLHAADVAGGEVIVPSFTFCGTPHAVCWSGARPVFADIKTDGSMCIDPSDVERKLTERTRAVVCVDAYGIASDYEALRAIGDRHGIKVLGDSAPAFGTKLLGRPIGNNLDAQIFSFHATKAFTTMEGGCLCSSDREMIERAKALRNFGQGAGGNCDEAGLNAKMTEVSALIGLEQLKSIDRVVEHRARMADRLRAGLLKIPGLEFAVAPERQLPVWLYFPIVVDAEGFGLDRDLLADALEYENIFARKYFGLPCHHMAAYSNDPVTLAETERVAYRVLALPVYNDMSEAECDTIIEAIARIHDNADLVREKVAQPSLRRSN